MSKRPTTRVIAELRAVMARQDKTQDDLARVLKLSSQSVSRRMRGQVQFRADELERIAAFLEVPVSTFYEPSPQPPKDYLTSPQQVRPELHPAPEQPRIPERERRMSTVRVVTFPDPVVVYEMQAGAGEPALLVDVFCPTCDGCGRDDHSLCPWTAHANFEPDDRIDDGPGGGRRGVPVVSGPGVCSRTAPAASAPDPAHPLPAIPEPATTSDRAQLVTIERTGDSDA